MILHILYGTVNYAIVVQYKRRGSVDKGLTPVFTLFPSDQVRLEFFKMGGGGLGSIAQAG